MSTAQHALLVEEAAIDYQACTRGAEATREHIRHYNRLRRTWIAAVASQRNDANLMINAYESVTGALGQGHRLEQPMQIMQPMPAALEWLAAAQMAAQMGGAPQDHGLDPLGPLQLLDTAEAPAGGAPQGQLPAAQLPAAPQGQPPGQLPAALQGQPQGQLPAAPLTEDDTAAAARQDQPAKEAEDATRPALEDTRMAAAPDAAEHAAGAASAAGKEKKEKKEKKDKKEKKKAQVQKWGGGAAHLSAHSSARSLCGFPCRTFTTQPGLPHRTFPTRTCWLCPWMRRWPDKSSVRAPQGLVRSRHRPLRRRSRGAGRRGGPSPSPSPSRRLGRRRRRRRQRRPAGSSVGSRRRIGREVWGGGAPSAALYGRKPTGSVGWSSEGGVRKGPPGLVVRQRWCGRGGAADGHGGAVEVVRLSGRGGAADVVRLRGGVVQCRWCG